MYASKHSTIGIAILGQTNHLDSFLSLTLASTTFCRERCTELCSRQLWKKMAIGKYSSETPLNRVWPIFWNMMVYITSKSFVSLLLHSPEGSKERELGVLLLSRRETNSTRVLEAVFLHNQEEEKNYWLSLGSHIRDHLATINIRNLI